MKDLSRIKCFCFDVDGTLTTGALYFGPQGEALKVFNAQDGMIINLVRKLGYKVAFITGRESPMVQARANELHIDYLAMKCGRKLDALHTVCKKFNLSLDELKKTMDPSRYVGRSPKQVEEFLEEVIKPLLEENAGELGLTAQINV